MSQSTSTILIMVVVIGFSLYRRSMRMVRFMPLRINGLLFRWIIMVLLILVELITGAIVPGYPYRLYILGIALGAVLGVIAGRMAVFEQQPDGKWRYRMNRWLGSAVILLLILRIALSYSTMSQDVSQTQVATGKAGTHLLSYTQDPYAIGLIALVLTYYAVSVFVIWRKGLQLTRR